MDRKWTPGPWCVSVTDGPDARNDGFDVLGSCISGMTWINPDDDENQAQANAYLIAAAPELYEALDKCREELMSAYHNEFDGVWDDSDFARLEAPYLAALAKARGEA